MVISELIDMLQDIQDTDGDLRVRVNNECGTATTLTEDDVVVYKNALGELVVEFDA